MGRGGKDKQARREGRTLGGSRKPEPFTGVPLGARKIGFGQGMMPSMPKTPSLGELGGDAASILAESRSRMRQAMLEAIKRMVESQGGQLIQADADLWTIKFGTGGEANVERRSAGQRLAAVLGEGDHGKDAPSDDDVPDSEGDRGRDNRTSQDAGDS